MHELDSGPRHGPAHYASMAYTSQASAARPAALDREVQVKGDKIDLSPLRESMPTFSRAHEDVAIAAEVQTLAVMRQRCALLYARGVDCLPQVLRR